MYWIFPLNCLINYSLPFSLGTLIQSPSHVAYSPPRSPLTVTNRRTFRPSIFLNFFSTATIPGVGKGFLNLTFISAVNILIPSISSTLPGTSLLAKERYRASLMNIRLPIDSSISAPMRPPCAVPLYPFVPGRRSKKIVEEDIKNLFAEGSTTMLLSPVSVSSSVSPATCPSSLV